MSNIAPRAEQSTANEVTALTNLAALATSGSGQAIAKTGSNTFANVSYGSGSGTVTGSGAANQVTYWSSESAISGSSNLTFDTASLVLTSSSSTAFTIAKSGSSYAFQVDTSTSSAVTGLKITSAAEGSGLALSVISSGSNENLTLDAKGSGTITIGGTSTGAITISRATTISGALSLNAAGNIVTQGTTALTVTRTGTSYAFQVDTNTTSSATGIKITAAAAGSAVAIAVISSGTNEALTISAKGGAAVDITLNTFRGVVLTQTIQTTGSPAGLTLTGAAHTTLTASTEAIDANFNLARTVQFATGALTTQRAFLVQAPTYGFVGASTITTATTVSIVSAPVAGTNTTITNAFALQAGGATTQVTASGLIYGAIDIPAHTLTVTGTTQVTSAGPAGLRIGVLTITDASVVTVDSAASLYIAGPPVQAGSVTLTSAYSLWIDAGNVRFDGQFSTYNAVTTAGWGVPSVYGQGRVVATTNARAAAAATYTVGASDGTFEVSGNVLVTTSTTHSFSLDVSYTDESNTARTMILPMAALAGSFVSGGLITNVTGAGPYESPTMLIRCKAATAITIRVSDGTFTTVVYNSEGVIKQCA